MVCPACGTSVPDPSLPCPSCGRSRAFPTSLVFWIIGILGLLVLVVAIAIPGLSGSQRASNDRNASASLKTLATANADFRSNDRDGNHVNDFWTGDVASLYCLSPLTHPPDPVRSIRLIERSIAGADSDPLRSPALPAIVPSLRPIPKSGYWYWAMRADASVSPPAPYRQDTNDSSGPGAYYNRDRFGFLTYPDSPAAGRIVFTINEGNTMFKRILEGNLRPSAANPPGPVTRPDLLDWPSDPALEREWGKME